MLEEERYGVRVKRVRLMKEGYRTAEVVKMDSEFGRRVDGDWREKSGEREGERVRGSSYMRLSYPDERSSWQ